MLRRLEGGSQVGGDDAVDKAVVAAPPVRAQDGAVVSGAVRRSEQISSKLFKNGGCRDSAKEESASQHVAGVNNRRGSG